MTPINFINFDGDSSPNTPIFAISEAMRKDIQIIGHSGDMEVLSYYYDQRQHLMVLEVDYIQLDTVVNPTICRRCKRRKKYQQSSVTIKVGEAK